MEKVIVFGGDGFCGWPISLGLSADGYDVTIVDDLSRRIIDKKIGCNSLTPILTIGQRILKWHQVTKKKIQFSKINIAENYTELYNVIKMIKPEVVIHLAEQRAAPYSMKSNVERRYTVDNNIMATHNLLTAITDIGIKPHIIHIGTMGVYGYGGIGQFHIPEGYVDSELKCNKTGNSVNMEIMFPPDPGSIYHMTKVMDSQMFYFYNKNYNLRITDLHQGIVWGTQTAETRLHEDLINRFDYDGDYGTVLNRFIVQGVINHPITVYGSGDRFRAFIHIKDTVECIRMAVKNPPGHGDRVMILNQTTEQLNLLDLAKIISRKTGAKIRHYTNPRKEADRNTLIVSNDTLLKMGLNPKKLDDIGIDEIISIVSKYKRFINKGKIIPESTWTRDIKIDHTGKERVNSL